MLNSFICVANCCNEKSLIHCQGHFLYLHSFSAKKYSCAWLSSCGIYIVSLGSQLRTNLCENSMKLPIKFCGFCQRLLKTCITSVWSLEKYNTECVVSGKFCLQ